MTPQQGIVLGLVLCLAQLHSGAQEEHLPPPSISVQPSPNVHLGESVTIVCRGPSQATLFRVEKEQNRDGIKETHTRCDSLDLNCDYSYQTSMNCGYVDQSNVSRDGSNNMVAQFRIQALCEGSVGSYRCRYHYNGEFSVPSELLDLVVTSKEDFDPNSDQDMPWMYIITGISVKVVLLLFLLLLLLVHLRRRREHESTGGKLKKQRPQGRRS